MNKFIILSILFSSLISIIGTTQSLPKNLHIDEENHKLAYFKINDTGIYDQTEIENVYLNFYESNYWTTLTDNYGTEDYVPASLTYRGIKYDSVGVQFKGQTSYRKAKQRGSEKLSFDIKMGEFKKDQEIDGYSTFNFNNAFDDPTFLNEVLYCELSGDYIPSPRSNFIHLYLNGEYWGLYPNIQQVNNDFVAEWFADNDGIRWRADSPPGVSTGSPGPGGGANWGDGTAALNDLGSDTLEYQKYYTLKSTKLDNPWLYLVDVCRIIDEIVEPGYIDSLQKHMNLDAVLWHLATEIIYSDDDSYVYKGKMDYSLYYDNETALLHLLEIDGNSVMQLRNSDWSLFYNETKDNYPLLNKLLSIPDVRQRYIAHVKTILKHKFNEESIERISHYQSKISSLVIDDPKSNVNLYTFNRKIDSLKRFIEVRKEFLLNDPEMAYNSPVFENISVSVDGQEWKAPYSDENLHLSINPSHTSGISEVNLFYAFGLYDSFTKVPMLQDGSSFEYELNGFESGQNLRFYFEAVADNNIGTRAYLPESAEREVYYLKVKTRSAESNDVVINEIMASNTETVADQDGEYDDWIELFNTSDHEVDLAGYYLSDKSDNLDKWTFPDGSLLGSGDYMIIWADEDGSQEGLHANFKLSKSGEEITLSNTELEVVDQLLYSEQTTDLSYARIPNGTGPFIIQNPSFAFNNDEVNSVSELEKEGYILYPNPASISVKLFTENFQFAANKLSIFDSLGNKLFNKTIYGDTEIDISQWNPGIYFVILNGTIKKLIVH